MDDHLTIRPDSGDLDVRPGDVSDVQVTRWLGGEGEATWELSGDELTLSHHCPLSILSGCGARYEVVVPEGVALTIDGTSGAVTAAEFESGLRISSENGEINVTDIAGPLSMTSTNGAQRGSGLASPHVETSAENGAINLAFTEVPDDVEATTQNGGVSIEVPDAEYAVTTRSDSGDVDTTVAESSDSPHTIAIRTDNGPVALHPAD